MLRLVLSNRVKIFGCFLGDLDSFLGNGILGNLRNGILIMDNLFGNRVRSLCNGGLGQVLTCHKSTLGTGIRLLTGCIQGLAQLIQSLIFFRGVASGTVSQSIRKGILPLRGLLKRLLQFLQLLHGSASFRTLLIQSGHFRI